MSDEQPPDESGWVVEPGLEIRIAVGADAQLTPEIKDAIDDLLRALESETNAEVEGFARRCPIRCKEYSVCNPQGSCQPEIWVPCAAREICRIADFA